MKDNEDKLTQEEIDEFTKALRIRLRLPREGILAQLERNKDRIEHIPLTQGSLREVIDYLRDSQDNLSLDEDAPWRLVVIENKPLNEKQSKQSE